MKLREILNQRYGSITVGQLLDYEVVLGGSGEQIGEVVAVVVVPENRSIWLEVE